MPVRMISTWSAVAAPMSRPSRWPAKANAKVCVTANGPPTPNVIASNGRMLTGSWSFAHPMSTHAPSRGSNASKVRPAGSPGHRYATR